MGIQRVIELINAEFIDAFNKGDASALTSGYADNCNVLVPNHPTIHGKEAVEAFFKGMIEDVGGTANLEIVEAVKAGDIAYQWSAYTLESSDFSDAGQLLEIFKRQPDGTWKIHLSMFNSDKP